MPILMFVAWLAILSALPAVAQHTHEGEVGKFYQTWMRPDSHNEKGERTLSCCNNVDCRPVVRARRRGDGLVEVQVAEGYGWYVIPQKVWEDAQPDPRESPDGRMHVCIHAGAVLCAVRGSDI